MTSATAVRRAAPRTGAPIDPTAPSAIEVEHLTVVLDHRTILRDVSFAVGQGERVAVLGPNGSGKTTLLRTLATLIRPRGGRVRIARRDPTSETRDIRASIGFAGDRPHVHEHLTGRENLEFFARLYGVSDPKPRAAEALEIVGLERDADRRVREYSRGMTQRLALATAAIHRPAVLLLDEPDAGLDREFVDRLPAAVTALAPAAAVLFSTHDAMVADRLAARVVRLEQGRSVEPAARPPFADDTPPAPRLPKRRGFFATVGVLVGKDLRIEARAREQFPTVVAFSVLLAIVFDMAFLIPAADGGAAVAAGVLWSSLLLAATLAGTRLFAVEQDRGTLIGLRLAPVDPSAVFMGKFTLMLAQLIVVAIVQLGVLSVLLNLQLFVPVVLGAVALAAVAISSVAALQSALVASSRARELLMPLVAVPLALPAVLASVGATLGALEGSPSRADLPWLGLLAIIAAVFLSLSAVLYQVIAEGE